MKLFWNKWHGKVALIHHISTLLDVTQKYKGLIGEAVMFGQGLVHIGHQGHSSLKFQDMEVVLVAMSPHYHPQTTSIH